MVCHQEASGRADRLGQGLPSRRTPCADKMLVHRRRHCRNRWPSAPKAAIRRPPARGPGYAAGGKASQIGADHSGRVPRHGRRGPIVHDLPWHLHRLGARSSGAAARMSFAEGRCSPVFDLVVIPSPPLGHRPRVRRSWPSLDLPRRSRGEGWFRIQERRGANMAGRGVRTPAPALHVMSYRRSLGRGRRDHGRDAELHEGNRSRSRRYRPRSGWRAASRPGPLPGRGPRLEVQPGREGDETGGWSSRPEIATPPRPASSWRPCRRELRGIRPGSRGPSAGLWRHARSRFRPFLTWLLDRRDAGVDGVLAAFGIRPILVAAVASGRGCSGVAVGSSGIAGG